MCTVSFYRDEHKTIITSNRDEHISRPRALDPGKYTFNNRTLFYPLDPQSGGTWFVVKDDGSVFVLLNGAVVKHEMKPRYRRSRGLVLLDIAGGDGLVQEWTNIDLEDIEPFTVVASSNEMLSLLRWDGSDKSHERLNPDVSHIWSSATLYDRETARKREKWFFDFLNQEADNLSGDDFLNFHTGTELYDTHNGLLINREQTILTKSVTQCIVEPDKFTLFHKDLISDSHNSITEVIV